ncbi:MAG: DUF2867 domain-containing protein [Desulfocurvibacter africanus]
MAAYPHWPILVRYPQILELIHPVDHADIKIVESTKPLRPFVAAMFSYSPVWVRMLFAVRIVLAWLMRLENPSGDRRALTAEDVPMQVNGRLRFFSVVLAKANEYWLAEAADGHLRGILGVASEPLPQGRWRHHVMTLVSYRDQRGPIYFNLIRPFHHLLVWAMARAGAR